MVQEVSSLLAFATSCENTQEILASFFGAPVSIRPLESFRGDLCDEVDRFFGEKAPPKVSSEAIVTVAMGEKKCDILPKPRTDRAGSQAAVPNPDKAGGKKMATVAASYT